jgi:histidinol-phosphate aminotransferase
MLKETIKLNMNEVPYLPPQEVIEAAQKGLSNLNRYTDPQDLERLRGLLADYSGASQERIILSPGSDLLLREVIYRFSKGRKVIVGSPSFFPTVQAARQFATKLVSIRLSPPEFDLNLGLLVSELKGPCLVILDNPNNPTGKILLDRRAVKAIVAGSNRADTLLVIDEAYYEFVGSTFADMVQDYPNLAVVRTMDKAFSLAGARVAYLITGEEFWEPFSSFDALLPQSSLYAAIEALKNPDYVRRNVQRVVEERERVWRALGQLGVQVYSSSTNFLLAKTVIPDIVDKFRHVGVLISDLSNQLSPGFVRVSIGTREENDAFIAGYMRIREAYGWGGSQEE